MLYTFTQDPVLSSEKPVINLGYNQLVFYVSLHRCVCLYHIVLCDFRKHKWYHAVLFILNLHFVVSFVVFFFLIYYAFWRSFHGSMFKSN